MKPQATQRKPSPPISPWIKWPPCASPATGPAATAATARPANPPSSGGLPHVQPRQLEAALLAWQDHVLGKRDPTADLVAVDAKARLSSQGLEVVSAYAVQSGRWLGSELVAEDSNEIPAAQELVRRVPIEGSLVTADAMHTQTETARIIVQERGADYLFPVKGNQKGVADTVRQLHQNWRTSFPPLDPAAIIQTCELNRSRTEARCLIPFDTTAETAGFPFVEQAARLTRSFDSAKQIDTEYLLTSRPATAMAPAALLQADRGHWGIESGRHLRLDVSAGEDRSRVRHRPSALNLSLLRRAALSVAVHWIQRARPPPPRHDPRLLRRHVSPPAPQSLLPRNCPSFQRPAIS